MKPAFYQFVAKNGIQQKKTTSSKWVPTQIRNYIIHYLGFGDGETYPFESDHGTQLNGTIVEGNTQRKKRIDGI